MWNALESRTPMLEMERHREHSLHRLKLKRIQKRDKPRSRKPASISPFNPRKHRLDQEKTEAILWENELLLKKIIDIDCKARIPALREPILSSLNRRTRIQELSNISRENQRLMSRLERTHSSYSVKRWAADSDHYRYLRQRLSENAGRVPRMHTYDAEGFEQLFTTGRPSTQHFKRGKSGLVRREAL